MAVTRIRASGIYGTKSDSALAGLPGVMPAPTATDAGTGGTVSVAFTSVTGSTSYSVISTPGNITASGSTSPISVTGLTDGTAYTFQIRGNNAQGNGAYSTASNSVTPTGTSFDSIASATGTGSTNTFTFSNIPSTYQHLQLRFNGNVSSGGPLIRIQFNGDTGTNYSSNYFYSSGTQFFTGTAASQTFGFIDGWGLNANAMTSAITTIYDYANTSKSKAVSTFVGGVSRDGITVKYVGSYANRWNSTSAITSITITLSQSNFSDGTRVGLYGIKG